MKNIIFVLCMMFSSLGFAQIGEAETVETGTLIGELREGYPKLEVFKQDGKNLFVLTYLNSKYRGIVDVQSITFYGESEDLESVYNAFKSASKETKSMVIGEDRVRIGLFHKEIMISVYPSDNIDSYFYLSKKEVDKLFGKA
jgi:hypothetical protein